MKIEAFSDLWVAQEWTPDSTRKSYYSSGSAGSWLQNHSNRGLFCSAFSLEAIRTRFPISSSKCSNDTLALLQNWYEWLGLRKSKNINTMFCATCMVAGKTLVSWTKLPQASRLITVVQFLLLVVIIAIVPSVCPLFCHLRCSLAENNTAFMGLHSKKKCTEKERSWLHRVCLDCLDAGNIINQGKNFF